MGLDTTLLPGVGTESATGLDAGLLATVPCKVLSELSCGDLGELAGNGNEGLASGVLLFG